MTITINGSGTITGATTLATTVASPTLTTPNIDSAQIPTVLGTAPLYMARAWVNFNGTGTVAIRGSGNVSSITDNGTGDYTVNFTTAMTDANYAPTFMIRTSATARFETAVIRGDVDPTTASLRFVTGMSTYGVDNYQMDTSIVSVSIFR
jgi:hypothetical protein